MYKDFHNLSLLQCCYKKPSNVCNYACAPQRRSPRPAECVLCHLGQALNQKEKNKTLKFLKKKTSGSMFSSRDLLSHMGGGPVYGVVSVVPVVAVWLPAQGVGCREAGAVVGGVDHCEGLSGRGAHLCSQSQLWS